MIADGLERSKLQKNKKIKNFSKKLLGGLHSGDFEENSRICKKKIKMLCENELGREF